MSSLQEKKNAATIKGLLLRKSSFEKLKCTAFAPLKVAGNYQIHVKVIHSKVHTQIN